MSIEMPEGWKRLRPSDYAIKNEYVSRMCEALDLMAEMAAELPEDSPVLKKWREWK